MGGLSRGGIAGLGLQRRWFKALELLILGDPDGLRRLARSAPPHMNFLMVCLARTFEEASKFNDLEDFDAWMTCSLNPLITELGQGMCD